MLKFGHSHVLVPSSSTLRDFMLSNKFSAPPLKFLKWLMDKQISFQSEKCKKKIYLKSSVICNDFDVIPEFLSVEFWLAHENGKHKRDNWILL